MPGRRTSVTRASSRPRSASRVSSVATEDGLRLTESTTGAVLEMTSSEEVTVFPSSSPSWGVTVQVTPSSRLKAPARVVPEPALRLSTDQLMS